MKYTWFYGDDLLEVDDIMKEHKELAWRIYVLYNKCCKNNKKFYWRHFEKEVNDKVKIWLYKTEYKTDVGLKCCLKDDYNRLTSHFIFDGSCWLWDKQYH